MQSTELGNTGASISALGFGTMPLSIQGRPDEKQGRRVLSAVLDAGVNLLDTADVYCLDDDDIGHSERLIESVLRPRSDRESIRIATKGGLRRPRGEWAVDSTPKRLRDACEASLRALRTEQIFLYQLHAPPREVPFERSVETLAELQREGKILHAGLSNVSVTQIRSARTIVEIVSVQNRLSPFFGDAIREGVVAECEISKITFLAYSPFGGKSRAGRIESLEPFATMAKKHRTTSYAVVLAWLQAVSPSIVPIPGASTFEHALDSLRASEVELSRPEISEITDARFH